MAKLPHLVAYTYAYLPSTSCPPVLPTYTWRKCDRAPPCLQLPEGQRQARVLKQVALCVCVCVCVSVYVSVRARVCV